MFPFVDAWPAPAGAARSPILPLPGAFLASHCWPACTRWPISGGAPPPPPPRPPHPRPPHAAPVRRAVEGLAKSHLIHLREAFLESHGETTRIARLIAASAAPLRALLTQIARLPEAPQAVMDLTTPSDESLAKLAELRMGVPGSL